MFEMKHQVELVVFLHVLDLYLLCLVLKPLTLVQFQTLDYLCLRSYLKYHLADCFASLLVDQCTDATLGHLSLYCI